jgi:hypothetical protein
MRECIKSSRRNGRLWFLVAALAVTIFSTPRAALAFGAEDFINGPFHHEGITERAATTRGFSGTYNADTTSDAANTAALDTLGWHADYIDSYLYSPLWWAKGLPSLHRLKISMATSDELSRLHFDDLTSGDRVHYTWRRYASGTMAGLLWAMKKDDVAAAQCLVGVSLHAMQDFYSHSNWIDDAARQDLTYFEVPRAQRPGLALYTGNYELPEQLGAKHHGKMVPACAALNAPGVNTVMSAVCAGISPLSNTGLCETFDACQKGVTVQHSVGGVTLPPNVLYLAPPGIALDNKWSADIGVQQRGLTGLSGEKALEKAMGLAQRQSEQWLDTLEQEMKRCGPQAAAFWQRVKTQPASAAERHRQFENYAQFPYQFLSAGPYPSAPVAHEEYFLRVRLKTATENGAGTDADIRFSAGGTTEHQRVLLDYLPGANPAIAYNDFEAGDDGVYVIGPFSALPNGFSLRNDAPDGGDVLKALGQSVLNALGKVPDAFLGIAKAVIGTEADHVGTTKKTWMPSDLGQVPTAAQAPAKTTTIQSPFGAITITTPAGQAFTLDVDGGDEGRFKVLGYIVKTGESQLEGPQGWRDFEVRLHTLECVRESKWDRGSNSDEPFLTAVLTPLPGANQKFRTEPFEDMDAGETQSINHVFQSVRVPKEFGMLNLPLAVYEHDDENTAKRDQLRDKFAGEIETATVDARDGFVSALGASLAADWKLEHIEVTAWSRNGQIKVGKVLDAPINRWIKGGHSESFMLNFTDFKSYITTTDDLLPEIATAPIQKADDKKLPAQIPPTENPTTIAPVQKPIIPPGTSKPPAARPPVNKTPANRPLRTPPSGEAATPPIAPVAPNVTPIVPDAGPRRAASGMSLDKSIYVPGEPIELSFEVRANLEDAWIGVLPVAIERGVELNAAHALETQHLEGRTRGKFKFTAPTMLGAYEFRLNDAAREIGALRFEVWPVTTQRTPTLKLPKKLFALGEPITLSFTAFDFYGAAWVGLLPAEIEQRDEALNAAHAIETQHLEGRTRGEFKFTAPTKAGNYDFRMNDSHGNQIATLAFTVAPTTPDATPTLRLPKQAFKRGETIEVSFTAFAFTAPEAWVGLLPANIEQGREALNSMHALETQHLEGKTQGRLKFKAPNAAGTYDFRLNDSHGNQIAVTPPFTIAD